MTWKRLTVGYILCKIDQMTCNVILISIDCISRVEDLPEIHESITHFNLHGNQNKQKPHASKRWGTNLSPQKSKYNKCLYWPKYQVMEEETSLIKVKPNILIQITYHSHMKKMIYRKMIRKHKTLHTQSNFWVSEETKFTMLPVVVLASAALLSLNT